jgi:hypothetical protein
MRKIGRYGVPDEDESNQDSRQFWSIVAEKVRQEDRTDTWNAIGGGALFLAMTLPFFWLFSEEHISLWEFLSAEVVLLSVYVILALLNKRK